MEQDRAPRVRALIAGVAIVMTLSTAATAHEQDVGRVPEPSVAAELQGIRAELRGIGELLRKVEEHQHVQTLLSRIRLEQERLSSIESQLRSARGEQEATEQEIDRLTTVEESWTRRDSELLGGAELTEEERQGMELIRHQRRALASRVETLRGRIVELENQLAAVEREILALEEVVDGRLGLR